MTWLRSGACRSEVANLVKKQLRCICIECDYHPNPDLDLDPIVQMGNKHYLAEKRGAQAAAKK